MAGDSGAGLWYLDGTCNHARFPKPPSAVRCEYVAHHGRQAGPVCYLLLLGNNGGIPVARNGSLQGVNLSHQGCVEITDRGNTRII